MKILYFLIILFSSSAFGFYSGSSGKKEVETSVVDMLDPSIQKQLNSSLSLGFALVNQKQAEIKGLKVIDDSTIERALDDIALLSEHKSLSDALGRDPLGVNLNRAFIAEEYSAGLPSAEAFLKDYLSDLKKDPLQGMSLMTGALERISPELFPLERAAVLSQMGSFTGVDSLIKNQMLKEMTQNIVPAVDLDAAHTDAELDRVLSTTAGMLLPVTAHSVFITHTVDSSEALNGTIKGILAQPDTRIKSTLAAQFLEKYPDSKSQLVSALASKNISVRLGVAEIPKDPLSGGA